MAIATFLVLSVHPRVNSVALLTSMMPLSLSSIRFLSMAAVFSYLFVRSAMTGSRRDLIELSFFPILLATSETFPLHSSRSSIALARLICLCFFVCIAISALRFVVVACSPRSIFAMSVSFKPLFLRSFTSERKSN